MTVFYLILFILAAVFFGLAAFGWVSSKVNLVALGLLCWVLVEVIRTVQKVN